MASTSGLSQGTSSPTYYDILEIGPIATNQQIKDAYKRLAILKHPDKNLGDSAGACAAFQQLQTAYDTLSDPSLRAMYDASIIPPNTTKAATPFNRPSSPQASGWRPATPPQRPSAPAPPESRRPKTSLPTRDVDRPWWLSQKNWFEISINDSVRKEKIYRDQIASWVGQGIGRATLEHMLQNELIYQAGLRRDLQAVLNILS